MPTPPPLAFVRAEGIVCIRRIGSDPDPDLDMSKYAKRFFVPAMKCVPGNGQRRAVGV
jgi:hypothetical protein